MKKSAPLTFLLLKNQKKYHLNEVLPAWENIPDINQKKKKTVNFLHNINLINFSITISQ